MNGNSLKAGENRDESAFASKRKHERKAICNWKGLRSRCEMSLTTKRRSERSPQDEVVELREKLIDLSTRDFAFSVPLCLSICGSQLLICTLKRSMRAL